jgi:hypothetical protein
MNTISIIIAILNFFLLVYVILGSKIKAFSQWLFPAKITLRLSGKNYILNCFSKDLLVIEFPDYAEMADTSIRTRSEGGRFYLDAVARSRDITKEIQDAFYNKSEIKFIDSSQNEYDVAIIHLSKDGIRTYLTLVAIKRLEIGKVPEGSILNIKATFGENHSLKMVGQAMLDLGVAEWSRIYRDKILPVKNMDE